MGDYPPLRFALSTMPDVVSTPATTSNSTGIVIDIAPDADVQHISDRLGLWLKEQGIGYSMQLDTVSPMVRVRISPSRAATYTPEPPTEGPLLSRQLARVDLEREILARMLAGPVAFHFPSLPELQAHVQMRAGIVEAARQTELAFHTHEADRPRDKWTETDHGFAIIPGVDLIDALKAATQPAHDGRRYAFSCYRASEYVVLVGMAEVIRTHNPQLYQRLQRRSEQSLIKSRLFHDTFLFEYGLEQELPSDYYVPGDRVWFRNPDERSADLAGFEGSWTIYLGDGLFANFWQRNKPYSLIDKCIEIYHWRHGLRTKMDGEPYMDEELVAEHCTRTKQDQAETARILGIMMKPRDASGTYQSGGCIDRTREYPCWVTPETGNLMV